MEALREALPHCRLAFALTEAARLTEATENIQEGAYHYVVAALGFQGRRIDRTLARACRQSGTALIRAPSQSLAGYLRRLESSIAS